MKKKEKTPTIGYIKVKKEKRKSLTGYNIYGKKVTKYLESYEWFTEHRCPICNSVMVASGGPYIDTYCIICGNCITPENFDFETEKKDFLHEMFSLSKELEECENKFNTLLNNNKVRDLNSKELPKL